MHRVATILILAAVVFSAGAGLAERPETGLYFGLGGRYQLVDGTGTWDKTDFEVDSAFGDTSKTGLSWDGKALKGGGGLLGYQINEKLAAQVGYTYFLQKKGERTVSDPDAGYGFSFTSKWDQQTIDGVVVFYPSPESGLFVFGGLQMVMVSLEITTSAAIWDESSGKTRETTDLSALGPLFGAGFEVDPGDGSMAPFIAVQYSLAEFDDRVFDVPDFKVKAGGIAAMAGIKWYIR